MPAASQVIRNAWDKTLLAFDRTHFLLRELCALIMIAGTVAYCCYFLYALVAAIVHYSAAAYAVAIWLVACYVILREPARKA